MTNIIKKTYGNFLLFLRYLISIRFIRKTHNIGYKIMTIADTIDFISVPGNSMIRFGDGEIDLINGVGIANYQNANEELAEKLEKAAFFNDKKMLICFPDSLVTLNDKKNKTKRHWAYSFRIHFNTYQRLFRPNYIYGNSFVSRPYIVYKDATNVDKYFFSLINIFSGRDVAIIEGEYSRSGVGNDLFSGAKSIKRILCPSKNAFDKYYKILDAALTLSKDTLILLALGPTAKPLGVELFNNGYWVLDIGHIDSEYEWFLRKTSHKISIRTKHTAECSDDKIPECKDPGYLRSIFKIIT